jgi:hypothetical protein
MIRRDAYCGGRFLARYYGTLFVLATICSTGCNLCCPPYLDDYATVGGKWARADPIEGRVGSAFSDPSVQTASVQEPIYPLAEVVAPDTPMFEGSEIIVEPAEEVAPMILGESW